MVRRIASICLLSAVFTGCSSGSGSSVLPQSVATPRSTAVGATQSVAVTIAVPRATTTTASVRHSTYISTNTKSAAIAVNGGTPVVANLTSTSANCATVSNTFTCTLTVSAPAGSDTFAATLYDGTNATGNVLSQGSVPATITAGQANTVALTLDGVIASIVLSLSPANPLEGQQTTISLAVAAKDSSGATIIGSDAYVTPITLSDSDTSGATTLSKTTLKSPSDGNSLTISYTGAVIGQTTFGATSGSVSAQAVVLAPKAAGTFNDYTTFGYDNQRDVYNPNSTAIMPANISSIHLGWQKALGDYNTQTQPILATGISGHAGVLFVGGGTGNVYAYDAVTGALIWTRATGQETYTCENSSTAYFGVGGTVAYDPSSKSLYVVGNTNPSPNSVASNSLYRLDAASGAVLGQVNFAPATSGWPSLDFSHTSVTLGNNGLAYVGTGATCDISSWRGRVAAVSVPSMQLANTFFTVWNGTAQPWGGGGVWGWGGVALDFDGNVLTGVGNTDNGSTSHGSIVAPFAAAPYEYSAFGDALVKLAPDLSAVIASDHPMPTSIYSGNSVDLDIQGTPAIFKPTGVSCDPMAALQGKSGTLYLYDTTRIGQGLVAQYQLAPSTYADGFLGGPAYSSATGLLYDAVSSSQSSLYQPGMIAINPGCGSPSVTWHASFGPDSYPSGIPRSVPAVSAGGVVFVGTPCSASSSGTCSGSVTSSVARSAQGAQRKPLICCSAAGDDKGALWALDASTGAVLNSGNPLIITSAPLRVPPTIDGNWIFVLDNSGNLYALTIDPSITAVSAVTRAVDSRMFKGYPAPRH